MENIKQYYRLCGVVPKEQRADAMINHLSEEILSVLLTQKSVDLYLTAVDGVYRIKETVIGGGKKEKILVIQ